MPDGLFFKVTGQLIGMLVIHRGMKDVYILTKVFLGTRDGLSS